MAVNPSYRFVLEVRDLAGGVLHKELLSPDWEPAVQETRLAGLRRCGVWHQGDTAEPVVEPQWHEAAGEPFLQGFRVHLSAGGQAWSAEFPATKYFGDAARAVVAARLAAGELAPDDRVHYAVAAYPSGSDARAERAHPFAAVALPQSLDLGDRNFGNQVAGSRLCGEGEPSDIDVVLPEGVLEEVCRLAREAGDRETGGVLIGHVCRDDRRHDVGLEITAQIPARHTVGDAVKLTFTPDTWTDVRAAVWLRNAGERLVGWWHSHPASAWCGKCPVERQRVCQLATGFVSSEDRALHRAMFPAAFTQALVVTHSVVGLDTRLFGWRAGVLQPRAFHLRRDGHAGTSMAAASIREAPVDISAACATGSAPPSADTVAASNL